MDSKPSKLPARAGHNMLLPEAKDKMAPPISYRVADHAGTGVVL